MLLQGRCYVKFDTKCSKINKIFFVNGYKKDELKLFFAPRLQMINKSICTRMIVKKYVIYTIHYTLCACRHKTNIILLLTCV